MLVTALQKQQVLSELRQQAALASKHRDSPESTSRVESSRLPVAGAGFSFRTNFHRQRGRCKATPFRLDNTGRYQIDITGPMYGSSDLDAHNLGIVVQQALSADNVPNHMKNGALLHRVFSDRIDLRLLSGDTIFVPEASF